MPPELTGTVQDANLGVGSRLGSVAERKALELKAERKALASLAQSRSRPSRSNEPRPPRREEAPSRLPSAQRGFSAFVPASSSGRGRTSDPQYGYQREGSQSPSRCPQTTEWTTAGAVT